MTETEIIKSIDETGVLLTVEKTIKQDKVKDYKEYKKEYNKKRYEQKKELLLEQQRNYYINRLKTDTEYRTILNERSKARHEKLKQDKELNGGEIKPRGRPKTKETKEKKPNGRPRKYD